MAIGPYLTTFAGGPTVCYGQSTLAAGTKAISTGLSQVLGVTWAWAENPTEEENTGETYTQGTPQMFVTVSGGTVTFTTTELAPRISTKDFWFTIYGLS